MHDIDYYVEVAKKAEEGCYDRNLLFEKIDAAVNFRWKLPDEIPGWVKAVKSTELADSLEAACTALSSSAPKLDIMPQLVNEDETERVEAIEASLQYQFHLANRRPVQNPFRDSTYHSLKYMAIAGQLVYLPYEFKGKDDKRLKHLYRYGSFAIKIHDPRNVFPSFDAYGLTSVVLKSEMMAQDILSEYAPTDKDKKKPGVAKFIKSLGGKDEKEYRENLKKKYFVYRYCDYDYDVVWVSSGSVGGDTFEFRREEHKLPFLPWIYRQGNNPILRSVIDSGEWDNYQLFNSIQEGAIIRTIAHPYGKSQTFDGEAPIVDHDDPANIVGMQTGEDLQPLPPYMLDPHLSEIIGRKSAEISRSTVAKVLSDISSFSNSPFSSMNVMLQTAIASLGNSKSLLELFWADVFMQMLLWVDHSRIPLVSKRMKTTDTDDPMLSKGANIVLSNNTNANETLQINFDPQEMIMTVEIRPDSAGDQQARLNIATLEHERLGVPLSIAQERYGLSDTDLMQVKMAEEQMESAVLQARLMKIQAKADMEIQQKMMEAQMQAQGGQPAPGGGQMAPEDEFAALSSGQQFEQAQGFDARTGAPTATFAPQMTREAITNVSVGGEEMI